MRIYIETFMGHAIFFQHISYSAPSLRLYGYSTDTACRRAIKRAMRTR